MSIYATETGPGSIEVQENGTNKSFRPTVNLIAGASVTITVVDNVAQNRADITIDASSGGSILPPQIDGGSSVDVYIVNQNVDGGDATSVYSPGQFISGGAA